MMIEFLRRKMTCFIWTIVIAFALSLFIGSASLVFFLGDRTQRRDREHDHDRDHVEAESIDDGTSLDLNSAAIAARIELDGQEAIITEGELNRRLKDHDLFKQMDGEVPPQLKEFFLPQILDSAIEQRLLALQARLETTDVADEVEAQMNELYQQIGGREQAELMGIDERSMRQSLVERLQYSRLIERIVGGRSVSEGEIQAYYEGFPEEFMAEDGSLRPLDEVRDDIERILRAHVSDDDVQRYYEEHKDRWLLPAVVDFRRIAIDPAASHRLQSVTFTERELRSYFESTEDEFIGPARYVIRHIFMDSDSLDVDEHPEPTEDEIARHYEELRDDFYDEEQIRTGHILFRTTGDDDEDAHGRAIEALELIRQGESFEDVARQLSEDVITRDRGGHGALWSMGMQDMAIEDAVFDLDEGEITGPVLTERGYEIIRLIERVPAAIRPLEEVRDEIVDILAIERREEVIEQRLRDLRARIDRGDLSFAEAAQRYSEAESGPAKGGLLKPLVLGRNDDHSVVEEVGERGFVDHAIQDRLRQASVDDLIGPVRSSRGHHLLLVEDIIPERVRPFSEVRDEVELRYRAFLAEDEAHELVFRLVEGLEAGELEPLEVVVQYSDGSDKDDGGLWRNVTLDSDVVPEVDEILLEETGSRFGLNDSFVGALRPLEQGQVTHPFMVEGMWNILVLKGRSEPEYAPLDEEAKEMIRFAINPDVPEDELRDYYEENRDEYREPARIVIQHVMLTSSERAEQILKKALAGADFDHLVADYSIDGASRRRSGVVEQEELPPAFTRAVEHVEEGDVVPQVLASPAGHHVVRLVSREEARQPSFEEVREHIRDELLRPRLAQLLQDYVEEIKQRAIIETWGGPLQPLPPRGGEHGVPQVSPGGSVEP